VTKDSNDALEPAHALPKARLVAVHNDSRGHFTESRADLARAFETLGLAVRLETLTPGRPLPDRLQLKIDFSLRLSR
jgi:hypothetical protein